MPLITFSRFLFSLVSLAMLGATVYLLWSYGQGEFVRNADGDIVRVREDWRLWTALGLLAWSLLGRFLITPLLAKPDQSRPRFERAQGRLITSADAVSLYVEEHGRRDGPTLLFTHGQGLDTTIWAYARRDLAKDYRLVFWDLPGLGKSKPAGALDLTVEAAAVHLRAVIEATNADRVVLVGHSFGGMTIQDLARSDLIFRRKVAGVVLLNTTFENPLKTMILSKLAVALQRPVLEPMHKLTALIQPLAWISNWQSYLNGFAHLANRLQFAGAVTAGQLEHTTLLSTRNPPGAIDLRNLGMYHWRGIQADAFDVPTLVIGGSADVITKPSASEKIARDIRAAELVIVPGANHMGPIENADVYNKAIAEFAAGCFKAEGAATDAAEAEREAALLKR